MSPWVPTALALAGCAATPPPPPAVPATHWHVAPNSPSQLAQRDAELAELAVKVPGRDVESRLGAAAGAQGEGLGVDLTWLDWTWSCCFSDCPHRNTEHTLLVHWEGGRDASTAWPSGGGPPVPLTFGAVLGNGAPELHPGLSVFAPLARFSPWHNAQPR